MLREKKEKKNRTSPQRLVQKEMENMIFAKIASENFQINLTKQCLEALSIGLSERGKPKLITENLLEW